MSRTLQETMALIDRCRSLMVHKLVKGIEGAPDVRLRLVPVNPSRIDITIGGEASGGEALYHTAGIVRVKEPHPDEIFVGSDGQRWSWGDFRQDCGKPDLTEGDAGSGPNGMTDAESDRICGVIAGLAAEFAAENPLALQAAGLVTLAEAEAACAREEAALRQKADSIAERLPRIREHLAGRMDAMEAVLEAERPGPRP